MRNSVKAQFSDSLLQHAAPLQRTYSATSNSVHVKVCEKEKRYGWGFKNDEGMCSI